MQRATVTVRLAGDISSTSQLTGVSPAEVQVLRYIHGDDAVVDIRWSGNDRGKQAVNEKERLHRKYRKSFIEAFPGANPQLPPTFADIGVDLQADDEDEDEAPPSGKGKGKGKGGRKARPAATEQEVPDPEDDSDEVTPGAKLDPNAE